MKRILVTGGSGFIGRCLIRELLDKYPDIEVTSISRSEGPISHLLATCPSERLRIVMADVRDIHKIKLAMRDIDTVIHLAAMKHVDLCEVHCREAAGVNIIGTMNLLDTFEGDTFIFMSTDKAVEPINCYGASKLVIEKLILEQARKQTRGARFMIVRSANIIGSTGSVLDIWKRQIAETNEIKVTDPSMTRMFIPVDRVVRLIIAMLERGENGKIYLTPREEEGMSIGDLAKEVIKSYGNDKTKIRIVGKRPGEKMHEKMHCEDEENTVSGFEGSEANITGQVLRDLFP